jgi:hypothetical protein
VRRGTVMTTPHHTDLRQAALDYLV